MPFFHIICHQSPSDQLQYSINVVHIWQMTVVPPYSWKWPVLFALSLETNNYLQYFKTILLLLLPFLPSLAPNHPDFQLCVYASGQVCQLYKRLHDQQEYISYSLLALHANFVAGLTMVYCFSMDKSIFNSRFSSDIRACSTVLYIIAARWPAARKVRSAFESLVSATIEAGDSTSQPPRPNTFIAANAVGPRYNQGANMWNEPQNVADTLPYSSETPDIDIWDLLGTVLDDKENSGRWQQEGFYNAIRAFPEYGFTLWMIQHAVVYSMYVSMSGPRTHACGKIHRSDPRTNIFWESNHCWACRCSSK